MTDADSPVTSRRCAGSVRSGTIGTEIPVGSMAEATAGPGVAVGGVLTSPAVTPAASLPPAAQICPRRNALHAELRSTGADPDALGPATAGATATAAERTVATPAVTRARGRSRARRGSRKRTTLAGTSADWSPTSGRSVVTNHPTAQPYPRPGSELPGGLGRRIATPKDPRNTATEAAGTGRTSRAPGRSAALHAVLRGCSTLIGPASVNSTTERPFSDANRARVALLPESTRSDDAKPPRPASARLAGGPVLGHR